MFRADGGADGKGLRECPDDQAGWLDAPAAQREHVGLPADHRLCDRIHELFLDVCPA